jgi:hypothetical protein
MNALQPEHEVGLRRHNADLARAIASRATDNLAFLPEKKCRSKMESGMILALLCLLALDEFNRVKTDRI